MFQFLRSYLEVVAWSNSMLKVIDMYDLHSHAIKNSHIFGGKTFCAFYLLSHLGLNFLTHRVISTKNFFGQTVSSIELHKIIA